MIVSRNSNGEIIRIITDSVLTKKVSFFSSDPSKVKYPYCLSLTFKTDDNVLKFFNYPIFAQMCSEHFLECYYTDPVTDSQVYGYITVTKVTATQVTAQFMTNLQAWFYNLQSVSWANVDFPTFTYNLQNVRNATQPGGNYIVLPTVVKHPSTYISNKDDDKVYLNIEDMVPAVNVNAVLGALENLLARLKSPVSFSALKAVFQGVYLTLEKFSAKSEAIPTTDVLSIKRTPKTSSNDLWYPQRNVANTQINFYPLDTELAPALNLMSQHIYWDKDNNEHQPYLYFEGQKVTINGTEYQNESFYITPPGFSGKCGGQGSVFSADSMVSVTVHGDPQHACWHCYTGYWNINQEEEGSDKASKDKVKDGPCYYLASKASGSNTAEGHDKHASSRDNFKNVTTEWEGMCTIKAPVSNSSKTPINWSCSLAHMMTGQMTPQEFVKELIVLSNAYITEGGEIYTHSIPGTAIPSSQYGESRSDYDWDTTPTEYFSELQFNFESTDQSFKPVTNIPIFLATDHDMSVTKNIKKIDFKFKLPGVEALGHPSGGVLALSNYDDSFNQVDLSGCLIKVPSGGQYQGSLTADIFYSDATRVKTPLTYPTAVPSVIPYGYEWIFSDNLMPSEGGFAMPKDLHATWAAWISCFSNNYVSATYVSHRDDPAYSKIVSFKTARKESEAFPERLQLSTQTCEQAEAFAYEATVKDFLYEVKAIVLPEPPVTEQSNISDCAVTVSATSSGALIESAFLISDVSLTPTHGAPQPSPYSGSPSYSVSINCEKGTYLLACKLTINNRTFDYSHYVRVGYPVPKVTFPRYSQGSVHWTVDFGYFACTLKSLTFNGSYDAVITEGINEGYVYVGESIYEYDGTLTCLGETLIFGSDIPYINSIEYNPESGNVDVDWYSGSHGSLHVLMPGESPYVFSGSFRPPHFGWITVSAYYTNLDSGVEGAIDSLRIFLDPSYFFCRFTQAIDPVGDLLTVDHTLSVTAHFHHRSDADLTTDTPLPSNVTLKWYDDFGFESSQATVQVSHLGKYHACLVDSYADGREYTYTFDEDYYEFDSTFPRTGFYGHPWTYELHAPAWVGVTDTDRCTLICTCTQTIVEPYKPWMQVSDIPSAVVTQFRWLFEDCTYTWYDTEGNPEEVLVANEHPLDRFGAFKVVIFHNGSYLDTLEWYREVPDFSVHRLVVDDVVTDYLTLLPEDNICGVDITFTHPDGTVTESPQGETLHECCLTDYYGWYTCVAKCKGKVIYTSRYHIEYPTVVITIADNVLTADLSNTTIKQGEAWKKPTAVLTRWLYNGTSISTEDTCESQGPGYYNYQQYEVINGAENVVVSELYYLDDQGVLHDAFQIRLNNTVNPYLSIYPDPSTIFDDVEITWELSSDMGEDRYVNLTCPWWYYGNYRAIIKSGDSVVDIENMYYAVPCLTIEMFRDVDDHMNLTRAFNGNYSSSIVIPQNVSGHFINPDDSTRASNVTSFKVTSPGDYAYVLTQASRQISGPTITIAEASYIVDVDDVMIVRDGQQLSLSSSEGFTYTAAWQVPFADETVASSVSITAYGEYKAYVYTAYGINTGVVLTYNLQVPTFYLSLTEDETLYCSSDESIPLYILEGITYYWVRPSGSVTTTAVPYVTRNQYGLWMCQVLYSGNVLATCTMDIAIPSLGIVYVDENTVGSSVTAFNCLYQWNLNGVAVGYNSTLDITDKHGLLEVLVLIGIRIVGTASIMLN